jgi:trehalose 6-phosphate phosphatase
VDEISATNLSPQQIGLFLDVDGTLIDLAPTPDAVEVPRILPDLLATLEQRLDGALALVSGRPIVELDRLFSPVRLRASGVHGAELRHSPEAPSECLTPGRLPGHAWQELLQLLTRFPGTFAENKGVGFAVHHRFAGDGEAALVAALRGFVADFADFDLTIRGGHRVFEIGPAQFSKGTAIEYFAARSPFAGRRPVFVADDRMDRPGFDAALALGGLAFSVGMPFPGLSGWFAQPAAVRAWLGRLAR